MKGEVSYYNHVISNNNIIYSCDMLRLKFHIHSNIAQLFLNYIWKLELYLNFNLEYSRPSFKIGTYKHLFVCKRDDFKFVIGCGLILNGQSTGSGMNCFIEFNPNKCDMNFMRTLLECIGSFVVPVSDIYFPLIRFDLAIDIPCPRSDVVLCKNGKREYSKHISASVTEYVGSRNTNGFVKVYDKTYESELEYDLTRVELTCDSFDNIVLPDVFIIKEIEEDLSELNDTDKVFLRLLRSTDFETQQQALKDMGRRKAEKLKKYLFPLESKFKYDGFAIDMICCEIENIMRMWRTSSLAEVKSKAEILMEEGVNDDEIYEQLTLFSEQCIQTAE